MKNLKFFRGAALAAVLSVSLMGVGQAGTIVDAASANPDFSTLVTAVSAAGLVPTLSGPGPLTVFAPTNDAFDKLPAKVLEKLLDPANQDLLVKLLKYHVVGGKVLAAQVVTLDSATTVEGSDVNIVANKAVVKVNNAKVIQTDLEVDNGVIHVIDTVITPKGFIGELNSR